MGKSKTAQEKVYRYWSKEIKRAQRELDIDNKSTRWEQNMAYLVSDQTLSSEAGQEVPVYNELGIAATELQVALYPNDPEPGVRVYKSEDGPVSEVCEAILAQDLKRCGVKKIARRIVQDNLAADIGIFKVTYKSALGDMAQGFGDETSVLTEELAQIQQENQVMMMGGSPPVRNDDLHSIHVASHRKEQSKLMPEDPLWANIEKHCLSHDYQARPVDPKGILVERVNPKNFLYDPEASSWEDRRWEAERVYLSLAELQDNPILKNTDKLTGRQSFRTVRMDETGIEPNEQYSNRESAVQLDEYDKKHRYEAVWFIHDRIDNQLIIMAEDHPDSKPLYFDEWPYLDDSGDEIDIYIPLVFNEVNDRVHGISDVERAMQAQEKYNEVMSWRDDHVSKFRGKKVLFEQGVLSQNVLAKFNDPNQTFIELKPGDLKKIHVFDTVPYPQDAYNYATELREYIRRVIGVYELMQGIPRSQTATQAQILNNQQNTRLEDRRRKMAEALEKMCETILKLHRKFSTVDIAVAMTGIAGVTWTKLTPTKLPSTFNVSIDVEGWYSANPEVRIRQTTEAMPFLQNIPTADQNAIGIKYLKLLNWKNPEKYMLNLPASPVPSAGGMAGPSQGQPAPASSEMPPWATGQIAGDASQSQVRPV
jgi:hypothetical protein